MPRGYRKTKDVIEEKEQQAAVESAAPRKRGRPRKVVEGEKVSAQGELKNKVEPLSMKKVVDHSGVDVDEGEGSNGTNGHGESKFTSSAAVKRFLSGTGFRISSEFYSAVDVMVEKMLTEACDRAVSNKRKIVYSRDL